MSTDKYPLGEPIKRERSEDPEWLKKLKARAPADTPPGIIKNADGKWETDPMRPNPSTCPHNQTIMGHCVACGKKVLP